MQNIVFGRGCGCGRGCGRGCGCGRGRIGPTPQNGSGPLKGPVPVVFGGIPGLALLQVPGLRLHLLLPLGLLGAAAAQVVGERRIPGPLLSHDGRGRAAGGAESTQDGGCGGRKGGGRGRPLMSGDAKRIPDHSPFPWR